MYLKVRAIVITCMIFFGCSNKKNGDNTVITSKGIYKIDDGRGELIVSYTDGILHFSLVDSNQTKKIISDDRISIYQGWALFYDDSKRLWVHSSDIGDCVYYQKGSVYVKAYEGESPEIYKELPAPLEKYINSR